MDNTTKSKILNSMKWTGVEALGTQIIQFVLSILIARQLMPEDYGLIGMLGIFSAIATMFISSGFGDALIQKLDANDSDYSTAFIFNVAVACTMYVILFFSAPLIATFYNQPQLIAITRISMLGLIIGACSQVHGCILSKQLAFKKKAIVSITTLVISGGIGLIMAFNNFGVWTLVWQGLISSFLICSLTWYVTAWRPKLELSKSSFRHLWGFGSRHLASSIFNTIYNNISTIVIGKAYSAGDLGLYSRANGFANLPSGIIMTLVMKVNYPILAELQNDHARLLATYKAILRFPIFILYPILFGMVVLASPLIEVLIGVKWLDCAPLLMILCLGAIWAPLTSINLNLLYVKGRTDLVLKLELIKKPIAFLLILSAIPLGIKGMCIAMSIYGLVAFYFNCYYTGKILNYGFWAQFKELLPILCYSSIMALIVYIATLNCDTALTQLCVGIPTGIIAYWVIVYLVNDPSYYTLRNLVISKLPSSSKGTISC